MNKNALPRAQLGLFHDAFPETNQVVVPVESKGEVLEVLALLLTHVISEERQPIDPEASHVS